MSNFLVSARKYRPLIFSDVVGQEVITKTLERAIDKNNLSQSLLFSGPRGVGKTTCARILAKEINNKFYKSQEEGDFSYNIFEIDAASNNSVEDIRGLIDQIKFAPQKGKYKVYIIDEAHMLSQSAFNAFLKTLEEPPEYVIFILATTEKQKIIPTILSRCQVFDFKKIGIMDIQNHIIKVASKEGVDISEGAANLIARKSDGSVRDSLSIFDRIVSFCGDKIDKKEILDSLNILDNDYYFSICDAIISNDVQSAIITLDEVIKKGYDTHNFVIGLSQHFRDLFFCKSSRISNLLEFDKSTLLRYESQANKFDNESLFKYLRCMNECELNYKSSKNQRLLLELTLINLITLVSSKNILESETKSSNEGIKADIKEVEKKTIIREDKYIKKPVVEKEYHTEKISNEDEDKVVIDINKDKKVIPSFTETIMENEDDNGLELNIDDLNLIKQNYLEIFNKKSRLGVDLFKSLDFKIVSKSELEIIFDSKLDNSNKRRNHFKEYIRGRLKDDNIQIKEVYRKKDITENKDDNQRKPFTGKEIYNHMLQSNPYLKEFKDKLNLELDY